MQAAPEDSGQVLCRSLLGFADAASGLTLLDAVAWADRGARDMRLFFAAGTRPDAFVTTPQAGCAAVSELREVSGGVMMSARASDLSRAHCAFGNRRVVDGRRGPGRMGPDGGPQRLPGPAQCRRAPTRSPNGSAITRRRHGMTGAVIIDRAQDGQADLAAQVTAAIADLPDLRVIIVASPLPLGRPDTGPEAHPFLAPDAPGKDRMERPEPDAWHAPLGQGLIYEIAKWRFLARARAVLTLDVSDLLAPARRSGPYSL